MVRDTDDVGSPLNQDEITIRMGHASDKATAPVSTEQAAQEIAELGVEGRPADPKVGPKWLWSELGAALAIVVCLTGVLGWVLGWAAGVAALAIIMIALVLNPVVVTTMIRAHERQIVVHRHDPTSGETVASLKDERKPVVDPAEDRRL